MIEFLKGTVTPQDWIAVGVILAATALICAGFYVLVYQGMVEEHQSLQEDLESLEQDLARAQEISENFAALEEETQKFQQLVQDFERRLPANREIPQLLSRFEDLANDVGLEVQVEQLQRQTDPRKETIPYQVVAFGDFHQIVQFINELERFERYLKVSDIEIEEEEALVSRASFKMSTFRFIEQPPQQQQQAAAQGAR